VLRLAVPANPTKAPTPRLNPCNAAGSGFVTHRLKKPPARPGKRARAVPRVPAPREGALTPLMPSVGEPGSACLKGQSQLDVPQLNPSMKGGFCECRSVVVPAKSDACRFVARLDSGGRGFGGELGIARGAFIDERDRPYAGTRCGSGACAAPAVAVCSGARSASSVSSCFSACTCSWRTRSRVSPSSRPTVSSDCGSP
jgi:hypothetical protein